MAAKYQARDLEEIESLKARAQELEAALRALVDTHDYSTLNRGIGTATPEGQRWLKARAALASVGKEAKP